MKKIIEVVVIAAISFLLGTILKNVWFGGLAAVFVMVANLYEWSKRKKTQKPPQAKRPKPAKTGKALYWISGIIIVIGLTIAGVPVIPLAVGAVLLVAVIGSIPGMIRSNKQEAEEFLDSYRSELDRDMENYKRRKALEEQKRKAARAEAEHLEDMARLWERNAQKYGSASDIQKARQFRDQANAAWRKIR